MIIHNDLVGTPGVLVSQGHPPSLELFFPYFSFVSYVSAKGETRPVRHSCDRVLISITPSLFRPSPPSLAHLPLSSAGRSAGILASTLTWRWYKPRDRPWGCSSLGFFLFLFIIFCFLFVLFWEIGP